MSYKFVCLLVCQEYGVSEERGAISNTGRRAMNTAQCYSRSGVTSSRSREGGTSSTASHLIWTATQRAQYGLTNEYGFNYVQFLI